ncbi:hypothetical protein [Brevundimonas sp.]|uniref:hypothetical protein n=1 Tax=Brevundimonas sp. TaxID=1871086 RepID=UPI002D45BC04|nr:hypothetical protein [Brevundimonas sp.]HYC98502.1 hypothetical protein [Brevundimonas sp.]
MQDGDVEIGERRVKIVRPKSAGSEGSTGAFLLGGLCLIFILGIVGMYSSAGDSLATNDVTTSWIAPPGFNVYKSTRGGGVATQWDEPTPAECSGDRASCFVVNVVTENDCPLSLYMSITLLNAAGQISGWTAETAQSVQPEERARLVFKTYDRGIVSARVAEIRCS